MFTDHTAHNIFNISLSNDFFNGFNVSVRRKLGSGALYVQLKLFTYHSFQIIVVHKHLAIGVVTRMNQVNQVLIVCFVIRNVQNLVEFSAGYAELLNFAGDLRLVNIEKYPLMS